MRLEKREVPEFVEYRRMYKGPGRWADETEVIKKGEPKYESKVQQAISKTEMEQEFLQSDMKRVQQLIDEWTLQPLKYGGPETQERWKSRLAPKP